MLHTFFPFRDNVGSQLILDWVGSVHQQDILVAFLLLDNCLGNYNIAESLLW